MALIKEAYTPNGINRIYQLLKNEAGKGTSREYDIKVDNLKVVSRTADPERFFEHEEFVMASSKHITVNIYEGASTRCNRYMLLLTEEGPAKDELSGIEKAINQRMQQERKGWEYERQKKEIERLTQELSDNEKYSARLQDKVNELLAEKQKMPGKLTETLIGLAGAYITRNPNALSGVPILGGLLGGGQETNQQGINDGDVRAESEEEDTESSFKRVKKPEYTGEVTDEHFDTLEDALIPIFAPEHLETISTVIMAMYNNTHLIPEIGSLLADAQQGANQAA